MDDTHKIKNSDIRYCEECGAAMEKEAKFCPKCGSQQKSDIMYTPIRENTSNDEKKEGINTGLIVALIISGIAAAVLLFLVINGTVKKSGEDKADNIQIQRELEQKLKEAEEEKKIAQEEANKKKEEDRDREIKELKEKLEKGSNTTPTAVPSTNNSTENYKPGNDHTYVMPGSDYYYITYMDLDYMSQSEIEYIRNEIYARKGYIFKEQRFKDFFGNKSWYYPNKNFNENLFSPVEKQNIKTIVEYEEMMGWR